MITLTRLTGAQFALNPDLVERVDCTPDTVITLVDGTTYLVSESLRQVADLALEYRARIVAGASAIEREDASATRPARLDAVPVEAPEHHRERGTDEGDEHAQPGPSSQYGGLSVVRLEPKTQ
jgi:flagellar protein FlbD